MNFAVRISLMLKKRSVRIGLLLAAAVLLAVFLLIFYANDRVARCAQYVYADAGQLPEQECALLLGTARIVQGKYLNEYFQSRTEAAAELYRSGKVRRIIVSGDNSRKDYDETTDMKAALVELGIPEKDILMDYAGFRTLDSVLRARNLFGYSKYVIVSQQFHCERAVFLARAHGMEPVGFAAKEVSPRFRFKRYFREPLARFKAWLDIYILHTRPHFEK
jgi:SanA protein